jgi:uncharacterized damage-inducible protein DinB
VSDDQRVSRNPGEPPKTGPGGAERWAEYLGWMRSDLIDAVLGISDEEQRTSRLASGWTPIELLSHVLHMEQRWFVWGFLGEPVAEPWGDWDVPDRASQEGRWRVSPDVTADDLAERLRAVGERTTAILREQPLDALAAVGGRFSDDPPTLEWICFHVLAEYARHAGHLDIAVELGAG